MSNIYGGYSCFLILLLKFSSISLHLRFKSALTLLNYVNLTVSYVKLTVSTYYVPIIIYQPSHQISESDSENKIKVVGNPLFSLKILKDTCLPMLICYDKMFPPT